MSDETKERLLLALLKENAPDLLNLVPNARDGTLSEEDSGRLASAVGKVLAKEGFGPDWEPNETGTELELLLGWILERGRPN